MSESEKQAAKILDAMYARGMNAKEFAAGIAAAEERGRRRGVEEAATLCDRRANGHVEGSVAGLEARKCANAVRDLAPRDSGKDDAAFAEADALLAKDRK